MRPESALSSALAVAITLAIPVKAAPQQMFKRATTELSLTAQLQLVDT